MSQTRGRTKTASACRRSCGPEDTVVVEGACFGVGTGALRSHAPMRPRGQAARSVSQVGSQRLSVVAFADQQKKTLDVEGCNEPLWNYALHIGLSRHSRKAQGYDRSLFKLT